MDTDRENPLTTVAIVTRRLKEGKTYEDFRRAWYHSTGFGLAGKGRNGSNRMYSLINIFDPREIVVIGFSTATPGQMEEALKIEVAFRGKNPLDEVVEPDIGRSFGLLVAEDDFSAAGDIPYSPAAIDGLETDMAEFSRSMAIVRALFAAAAQKRDQINETRKKGKAL